ncbi:hypothetical protein [Oceanotoga teriensis]|jgi:outer membrane protein insertion porin family|uniref:Outer membrane protein insertion porin family n=1 Tax=Oceanotoga teriensis TaxID=515440 RepID=A0AA45C8G7_9BACT|nr:hypothetical protein [Oceanotoga teriensis]MDO7975523.1 hypothetical protein [Oceanotoga teriensis]PWJ96189.1 outer membrane protein insertion porin family [Oceanotoga teriensis]
MKKSILMIFILSLLTLSFSITKLNSIEYSTDISYAATDINNIMNNYDIKIGNYVGDIDIKLAMKQVNNLGFFNSLSYELDEENGNLKLIINPNPIVKNVEIEVYGDGFVDKKDLKDYLNLKTDIPLNVYDFQKALNSINLYYTNNDYSTIEISSNIKLLGDKVTLEATEINNNKYDENTLLFIINEYKLWDLKLEGEYAQLDKEKVKKDLNFKFRKDYENKFFLFRPKLKESYPDIKKLQGLMSSIASLPYFSEETSIKWEPVDIEESLGGELNLVLDGKLRRVIDDNTKINKIKYNGNDSIESFRLNEKVSEIITENSTVSNLDILKSLDVINKLYTQEGFLFVDTKVNIDKNNDLIYNFNEKKVGNIKITKDATAKTQDYIIDDLIKLKKDEVVNLNKLQDTYRAFTGTGFFQSVDINPISMSEDSVDFEIHPHERTNAVKIAGGLTWSMPDVKDWYYGFAGTLSFYIPNPFGYGQTFGLNTELNPLNNKYKFGLNYNVSKIFKTDIDLGLSTSYLTVPNGEYVETLGASITNNLSFSISPSFKFSDFSYITTDLSYDYYQKLKSNDIKRLSTGIGYKLNRLDNPYRPYSGEYFSTRVFGGLNLNNTDQYYTGNTLEGKYFTSFYKFTFGTRLKIGFSNDPYSLFNYSVGGMNSVRRYSLSSKQGNNMYLFNTELAYELLKNPVPIDIYAFYDNGNTSNNLNNILNDNIWSFGTGLKFNIPLLGQIRFEYGWDKNLKGKFEFGFGQVF